MAKQFTITPNYLREIDLNYDLASQSDLFRENTYKAIASKGHLEAQDYLDSIRLTKYKTADTFDVNKYNMFTDPEDQIGYLRNEYFLKTNNPDMYKEASKYYDAKYQEALNEQYYNSLNWFEKSINTVGGFFARVFQGAYSVLEGVADAVIGLGGTIAEGGTRLLGELGFLSNATETAADIKKGTESAIQYDLTGLDKMKQDIDNFISTSTALSRSEVGRIFDSAAESIGKMAPLIIASIASGGTTIPASAKFFLGQGAASATYYGAMAGETYRDLINTLPDSDTGTRLLSTVASVGIEMGTEALSDIIFPTIHNIAGSLALQTFTEGLEEVESEIGGALMNLLIFNRPTVDPNGEFSVKTVLEAMIVGSLVGGIMGGGQVALMPKMVKTSDGKLMKLRDAKKAGLTNYTVYGKAQSFNILSRLQQLGDQFDQTSNTQNVLNKFDKMSVVDAQSDSDSKVRDAINEAIRKDTENNKRIVLNSLALQKFADLIGETEFNNAMKLLENATTVTSETINKYTNFQYSDNKYVNTVQKELEKLNPNNKFEVDNDLRGDYLKLSDILRKNYGVQLAVGKALNKDGNANSDIMTTGDIKSPDGIVFMDRETLNNISLEAALSQIINKQLATAFKNDSANAFSMYNKEYEKLVDVVLGEEKTQYTEDQIKNIIADRLLFDDKAITRAFFGSKATVRRMFNWLHKSIKQTQMAVKNEATKIKYNTLLKIKQRWIKNIGKVIGNVIDMQNAVRRYSLDPQDEELLKQSMTDINELNRHLIMTDIDFSPFAINKYATTRYLLGRTINDKKAADLNFDSIYDPNYYEADFVAEINNAYPDAKSFGEAMFDYVHDRFDMFISKENKALVRAISLTEFLNEDKLDKTIRELKESKRFQLSDFFDKKLFSNFSRNVYPDTSVYIEYANQPVSQDGVVAWYDTDSKSITLNVYTDTNLDTLIPVLSEKLLHETTHYIADTQGLSAGGNPDTYSRAASWLYSNRNGVFNDLADVLLGDQMTDIDYENMSVSDKIREMGKMMYTLDVGEMYARGMSYEYSKFDGFSMREKGDYMVVEAHGIYSDIWNTRVNMPLDMLPDYRSMSKDVKPTSKKQYMKRNFMEEFNNKIDSKNRVYEKDSNNKYIKDSKGKPIVDWKATYEKLGFSEKVADELAHSLSNADVIERLIIAREYDSSEAMKRLERMLFADNTNIKSLKQIDDFYNGFLNDFVNKHPNDFKEAYNTLDKLFDKHSGEFYYYIAKEDLTNDSKGYSKFLTALRSDNPMRSQVKTTSLDRTIGEESNTRISDLVPDEDAVSVEESISNVGEKSLTPSEVSVDVATEGLLTALNNKSESQSAIQQRIDVYKALEENKNSKTYKQLYNKYSWNTVSKELSAQSKKLEAMLPEQSSDRQMNMLEEAKNYLNTEYEKNVKVGETVPQQMVLELTDEIKEEINRLTDKKKVELGKKAAEQAKKTVNKKAEDVKETATKAVEEPAKVEKKKVKTEKPATEEQAVLEKFNETPGLEVTADDMKYTAPDGEVVDTVVVKAQEKITNQPISDESIATVKKLVDYTKSQPKESSKTKLEGMDDLEYYRAQYEKFYDNNAQLLDSISYDQAIQIYAYAMNEAHQANLNTNISDGAAWATVANNYLLYLYNNRNDARFESIRDSIRNLVARETTSSAQRLGLHSFYDLANKAVSDAAKEANITIDNETLNKITSKVFGANNKEAFGKTISDKLTELTKLINKEKDPFRVKELNAEKRDWLDLANALEEGNNAILIDKINTMLLNEDTNQIDNMQTIQEINATVLDYLIKTTAETQGLDTSKTKTGETSVFSEETTKKLRNFFNNMISIQYLAMLSSPRTALKNAYSNTMVLATAVVEDAAASIFYNKGFLSEGTQVGYVGQYDAEFKNFVEKTFGPYIRSKNEGSKYFATKGTELKEQYAESQSITAKNKVLKKVSDIESKMLSDKFWTNKRSMRNLCNSLVGSKSLILLESEEALKILYYKQLTKQQRNVVNREQLYSIIKKTNSELAELYKDATSGSGTSNISAVQLGMKLNIDLLKVDGDPKTSLINNSLYRANKILFKTDNVMTKLLENAKKNNMTGVTLMIKLLYPFARMTVNGATYILDRSPVGVIKGVIKSLQTKAMYYSDMQNAIMDYYKGLYTEELRQAGTKLTDAERDAQFRNWFNLNAPEELREAIKTNNKAGIKKAYQALVDSAAIAPGLIGRNNVFSRAEAIESLSQGITGSAVITLGLILAAITGAFDYDDDDDYLGPIVRFGDLKIALEDLAPYSTVFTLGAMLGSGKRISDPIKAVVDTFVNQSFLGVLDSAITYSNSVGDWFKNTAINYLTRFQPAIIKNANKLIYNKKKAKSGDFFTKLWYTLASNTLTLAWSVPNKINPYTGEAEKYYETSSILGGLSRLLPAQIYIDNKSELEKEAMKYDVESSGLSGTFKINGVDITLTPKQKEKYATLRALCVQQLYEKLKNGEKVTVEDESGKRITITYANATEDQKATIIKRIYNTATSATKIKYWTDKGNTYVCTTADEYNKYKELIPEANLARRSVWSGSKFVQA